MQLHTEITLIANVRFVPKTNIGGIYMHFGKKSKELPPWALKLTGTRLILMHVSGMVGRKTSIGGNDEGRTHY
jgi:hypothetical protein